jgi:hypothetical protein
MNKEFIQYEEALALKELGFDEECLFRYTAQEDLTNKGCYDNSSPFDAMLTADEIHESHILAPLYQQAFRWFREKYSDIDFGFGKIHNGTNDYHYHIDLKWEYFQGTYEEAELACLKKLIELVKENKDD